MKQQSKKYYFGAGQARLPQEVVQQAAAAVLDYNGLSILEVPHRSEDYFIPIINEAKALVLELCNLSSSAYEVLWLTGGGRHQFAMMPMNFLGAGQTAAYVDSGFWAHDAAEHAKAFGNVELIASSKSANYVHYPSVINSPEKAYAYLHITTNNTIYGTQIQQIPTIEGVPLFADMSSDIFSVARDYAKFDLFYAVAQKNLGAAGVTLVVLKKTLLTRIVREMVPIFSYKDQVAHQSMINTPPVFNIYVSLLYLRWLKEKQLSIVHEEVLAKAALLYEEIERNTFLEPIVDKESRSLTNIVFRTSSEALSNALIAFCQEQNIEGIEGHRRVGGFRVSLYNGNTLAEVTYLVSALRQFENTQINSKQSNK